MKELTPQTLDATAFEPYGWVLGLPVPSGDSGATFRSAASDFWQAHVCDCGQTGQPEVLWVSYCDSASPIRAMEKHLLTQQAVIPLNGDLVQFVACSGADGSPDLATLAAFRVRQGQGICMRPGCWHGTRIGRAGEVLCAMLTRRSTTLDLVRHLAHGEPARESTVAAIAPHGWRVA